MGSNFFNDILSSEGSHLPNISSKITELINQSNALKADFRTVVEHSSIHFTPLLKENQNLQIKSSNLIKEMTAVQEQIDGEIKSQIFSCTEELESLSSSLKEVKLFLEILKQLMEISTLVRKAKEKMQKKEFYECSQSVLALQEMIKSNSENLKLVEMFKLLSQEVVLTYEQLMYEISQIWSHCVNIKIQENLEKGLTEIKIEVNIQSCSDLNQILKASNHLKSNLIEKRFSTSFLNDILKKVILKKSKINSKVDDNSANLLIEIYNVDSKPGYLEVFENIKIIFEFVKLHLDTEIDEGLNFLSKVGSCIADEFADCLIKNCLSETIPTSTEDLDKYKVVVENTEVFEKALQETGFLSGSSPSLLEYARNINVLFANKFCQSYLHKARTIMKKDLYSVTKSEEVISKIDVLPQSYRNLLKEKLNIQEDVFLFPSCQISKQADELMAVVHSMMKEIQKSLDLCAGRLLCAVRNIFEMYAAVVPLHHKKFLETLPNQVALFHNNCMYFAHVLINLTTEYYHKISSIPKEHFTILLEEAIVLRSLAAETLEINVTTLRNQLLFILRDSGFATLNENPKLDPNSEKSIRQCIRQMQILQTVWIEVLPLNVYNRAIGFLLDSVVEELINLIISAEDISSQVASELVSSFTVILDKAPNLFPDPKEIHRHSRKWQKFKEFVLVLNGSLRDIDDRWADGLGPLAVEFTPEQVKHLIRALFQNSQRRAALLSRIR